MKSNCLGQVLQRPYRLRFKPVCAGRSSSSSGTSATYPRRDNRNDGGDMRASGRGYGRDRDGDASRKEDSWRGRREGGGRDGRDEKGEGQYGGGAEGRNRWGGDERRERTYDRNPDRERSDRYEGRGGEDGRRHRSSDDDVERPRRDEDRDRDGRWRRREDERYGSRRGGEEGRRDRARDVDGDGRRSGGGGGGDWRSRDGARAEQRQRQEPSSPPPPRPRGVRQARDEDVDDDAAEEEYDEEHEQGLREARGGSGGGGRVAPGPSGPPLRDSLQGEALYGVFPVLAALRAKRRKVHRAFMLESMDLAKRKDAGLVRQVEALCREAGVEVVRTGRHELNLMSHDRPHQGLVLDVSPLQWTPLDEFPVAEQAMQAAAAAAGGGGRGTAAPVWLALDEVVDPQNLGAVVRSAYCLGAAGVLACSKNCAPLSSVVSKASAGALEALPLHSCHNLPRTLQDARDRKGWTVLGAAAGSGSQPVSRVAVTGPTILVLGSEGFGLRTMVRRACSGLVRVEMAPTTHRGPAPVGNGASAATTTTTTTTTTVVDLAQPEGHQQTQSSHHQQPQQQQQQSLLRGLVDSLNVSVATGILLHSLLGSAAAASTGGGAVAAEQAVPGPAYAEAEAEAEAVGV